MDNADRAPSANSTVVDSYRGPAGPVLRSPTVHPDCPVLLALAVRLVLIASSPTLPTPTRNYVDVANSIAGGHGFQVDFIWIFAESAESSPSIRPSRSLATPTDAARVARPGPVPLAVRVVAHRVGPSVRPHRVARRAAGVAIVRDADAASRVCRAGVLTAIPALSPCTYPARQLLALPAARRRAAVDGGPRTPRPRSIVRNRRAAVGLATCRGTTDCSSRDARSGVLYTAGGVAIRGARRPAIPLGGRRRFVLFLVIMPRVDRTRGLRQLSPSTARQVLTSDRSRNGTRSRRRRRSATARPGRGSFASQPGLGFVAPVGIFTTLVAPESSCRSCYWRVVRRRSVDFGRS